MTSISVLKQNKGWEFSAPIYEKQELFYINKLISNLKKNGFSWFPTSDKISINVENKKKDFSFRLVFNPHRYSENSSSYIINPLNDRFLTYTPISKKDVIKNKDIINQIIKETNEGYPKISPMEELDNETFQKIWDENFKDELEGYISDSSKKTDLDVIKDKLKKISDNVAQNNDFFSDDFCIKITEDYKKNISIYYNDFKENIIEEIKRFKSKNKVNDVKDYQLGRIIISEIINGESQNKYDYEREEKKENSISIDIT